MGAAQRRRRAAKSGKKSIAYKSFFNKKRLVEKKTEYPKLFKNLE
jgi:hypothetical protein